MPRSGISLVLSFALAACASIDPGRSPALRYPEARRSDVVDDYHGTQVQDPYRWLEDADSAETRAWIEAENEITFDYLASIPSRGRIRARLTELWDFERTDPPEKQGGRYFFRRNDGLQNQSVLYVADSLDAQPRVVLDPNTLSQDGTVALSDFVPSPDGKFVALGFSDGGSDWRTWHILSVETGVALPDRITRNKFGDLDWNADSNALIYERFARPAAGAELVERNDAPEICVHVLGTREEEDALLSPAPTVAGISQSFAMSNSRRGAFLVRWDAATRNTEIDVVLLTPETTGQRFPVVSGFDAQFDYVGNRGRNEVWIRTNLGAPRWKIVAIDLAHPERESWRDVIPEAAEAIESASAVGDRLVVSYLEDARSIVRVFATDGTLEREVELPGIGTAFGFDGELDDPETFFGFTSTTRPSSIHRYDVSSGATSLFRAPELHFDPAAFEIEQVFVTSKDGTRVPMFLTRKKGLEKDGRAPTYLYGYGGFNVSLTPSFSVPNLVWLELGGILAIPNLRGGGEYGEDWHVAGTKLSKQNVFDDFIAAAEWLIASGWTSPDRLAIGGASNGGLLVGACMTQRPELFGAALPAVGVMDMLRYHKFTIGWVWAGDYGTAEDPAEFRALHAYSPLHRLAPGTAYPATLVTTADHDDRVVPAHSFKFAAALQAAQAGPEPVLIRIETRAGHGAGKPVAKQIEEAADRLAFLVRELGME